MVHPPETPTALPKARYHHGDLRHALIVAAEALLAERGVEGFSLREAARRAGVSPAAPAHHFGDARGLLTVIATLGFDGLATVLTEANATGQTRDEHIRAQGRAYVRYALEHPARFDLMWRHDALDREDAAFQAASLQAFQLLHVLVTGAPMPAGEWGDGQAPIDPRVAATWAIVHGFAALARQGTFDAEAPGLLDGVLACLKI